MNEELKKQWVQALRSGEYKQGRLGLRKADVEADQFCCLGVLCDISGEGQWEDCELDTPFYSYVVSDVDERIIPRSMRKDSGLVPGVLKEKWELQSMTKLISLNDSGEPFDVIADWIEENL